MVIQDWRLLQDGRVLRPSFDGHGFAPVLSTGA
jgi:hypothetical protein